MNNKTVDIRTGQHYEVVLLQEKCPHVITYETALRKVKVGQLYLLGISLSTSNLGK